MSAKKQKKRRGRLTVNSNITFRKINILPGSLLTKRREYIIVLIR